MRPTLFAHPSGLRDFLDLVFISGRNAPDLASRAEIFKLIARQKGLNNVPGAEWVYRNSNYFLLDEIGSGENISDCPHYSPLLSHA
ncbi:MAG: hypothetical protein WA741_00875 [Candidatus Sulfotelmatobacter sp.]